MTSDAAVAAGRPGAGELLASEMDAAAERRPRRRDLKPLASLWPYVRAHWKDALASAAFLLVSTGATLSLTG
ncbi:MAG TPA: ABC transporter, partial [Caulobacteraceae bacterium]|nr:ABC transporter [Caulobacteraceae bacterium]